MQPGPPQVQPGVPIYEAYPRTLLALNGLPTMQERIGNRYWNGAGNPAGLDGSVAEGDTTLPSGGLVEDRRAWARIEGVAGQPRSRTSTSADGPNYDMDVWKLQVGMDRPVRPTTACSSPASPSTTARSTPRLSISIQCNSTKKEEQCQHFRLRIAATYSTDY